MSRTSFEVNGQGLKSEVEVKHVDRKSLRLKINSVISAEDNRRISLFLGLPKKDAFELNLNYKDPFLKGYSMTSKMNDITIQNRVIPEIKESKPPKIEVLFPEIKYLGNMINASNKKIKAIVFINNKEKIFKIFFRLILL